MGRLRRVVREQPRPPTMTPSRRRVNTVHCRALPTPPAKGDRYDAGGISETFTISLGVSRQLMEHWRLMAEIGGVGAISEARKSDMMIHTQTNLGLYGALAIGWQP